MKRFIKYLIPILLLAFSGCVGIPEGVDAITGFELDKYLGTWYEIARFDHTFERGLSKVTATYSLNEDGSVKVLNKGYNAEDGWSEAEGKAYLLDNPNEGRLKVTFFWPFYGGYNIIELDKENYSYALVCGDSREYLWILSRTPELPKDILNMLIDKAKAYGFDTDDFIYVEQ